MSENTAIPLLRQRPRLTAATPLRSVREPPLGRANAQPAPARSLYIHIPFCFHKCHYCDFYSLVDTRDRQGPFVSRLVRELRALGPWAGGLPLRTLFVGGGTPTLLRPALWRDLLTALSDTFDLSSMARGGRGGGEFTVECNPETATPELMGILAAGGVNRVSVGAQSFNPAHLKTLERWHDPANVARAIEMARGAGILRQSLDLIFGIPGQTLADWQTDLDTALGLGTSHLSCYNLTYEPATAMTARLKRGEFAPADEDLELEMFDATLGTLRAAGLERYEVSNFARPGDEARHNLAYWRQEPWLAAGPSASAHIAGHRWKNSPRLDDYLEIDDGGFAPITDHEPPDPLRALSEKIMTGLRLAEGLDAHAIAAEARRLRGERAAHNLLACAQQHRGRGLLNDSTARWVLTDAGFLLADGVAAEFMAALDP